MPKGGVYQTDTDGLKHAVKQMYDMLETASDTCKALSTDIDSIDAAWSGSAHDDFMEKLRQTADKLPRLIREMYSYADDMKAVCGEYEKTDDEIGQIVSALGF